MPADKRRPAVGVDVLDGQEGASTGRRELVEVVSRVEFDALAARLAALEARVAALAGTPVAAAQTTRGKQ